ncbi:Ion-translocating oxidoreductase complex subunit B [Castellaniella defragrans]
MSETMPVEVMKQHLIDPEICIRCNSCEEACPIDAITHDSNNYVVKPDVCLACQACLPVCPTGAIDNWIRVLAKETYPIAEQFEWMSLPAEQPLPEGAVEIPTGGRRDGGESAQAGAAGGGDTADEEVGILESAAQAEALIDGQPATKAGSSVPPWSAAHPYVNLYTHKNVAEATVAGNYRISADDAESDIRHIVLDFEGLPFPVLEGQSIAESAGRGCQWPTLLCAAVFDREPPGRRAAELQQPVADGEAGDHRLRRESGRGGVLELPVRCAPRRQGPGHRPLGRHLPDAQPGQGQSADDLHGHRLGAHAGHDGTLPPPDQDARVPWPPHALLRGAHPARIAVLRAAHAAAQGVHRHQSRPVPRAGAAQAPRPGPDHGTGLGRAGAAPGTGDLHLRLRPQGHGARDAGGLERNRRGQRPELAGLERGPEGAGPLMHFETY